MSAHEVTVTLIGKNLTKYTEVEVSDIMNKRHAFDWCFYETGEYLGITDNEIHICMNTKNCDIEKVIKNVKTYMPEVESVRYWCKPYWMNTIPCGTEIEMFFWTKNKELRKECFYDARISKSAYSVIQQYWEDAWERTYKRYCEDNDIEYIKLKDRNEPDFIDEDGEFDSDTYWEYVNDRYDCMDYSYLADIEDELYNSFIAYTTLGKHSDVTIWIH